MLSLIVDISPASRTVGVISKILSEYDQETTQSQTADKHMAPQGRATQQSRDTRKTH